MKPNKKSFTANNSKRLSTYRPNSAIKNSKVPLKYTINNSLTDMYPPITITMPSHKKPSRMGHQITREELYEENMHLKNTINKMKKELDEVKNKLFKRGLELNKKDKIIRDCSKENVTEYTHEMNLEKAKESALLTMCKEKYIKMKKDFEKKCDENEVLKANIKITKLKEYQIQIDVLKLEMEKLRTLYNNSQKNYESSLRELKEMEKLKSEFSNQHIIINSLNKKYQDLSTEMNYILEENDYLKGKLSKNQIIQKQLKLKNTKLKQTNEKYMELKKKKENSIIVNNVNLRELRNLRKDVAEYKRLYYQQEEKYKNALKAKEGMQEKVNKNIFALNKFNYNEIKQIEHNKIGDNKADLYKSLLDEAKIKNSILENFLREHDIDPELILKEKGYEGVVNINTNHNLERLKQKINKSTTNNSTNTKDATSVGTKENPDQSKNLNNNQSNLDNNKVINNIKDNTIKDKESTIKNINSSNDTNNNNNGVIHEVKEEDQKVNDDMKQNEIHLDENLKSKESEEKKETEENKENKEIKESKGSEDNKEIKETEDNKENEEKKETEENKEIKDSEDNKEIKDENKVITHENQDSVKMTDSQNTDYLIQEQQLKETQILALLHTFVKNLEANHITKETLIDKIKEISKIFENKEEATKDEFIQPFVNLFIDSMKVTQANDIKLINEFFNNFIDDMEGDTNRFFLELIDIFENVVDYTLVENEEDVLNAIAFELYPYKEELKKRLEQKDKKIITFDNLRTIIEDLNISLTDDYTEFLIYKMKERVPEKSSIFDLDYSIILELLDKNLINNINESNDTNKEEDKKINEVEDESKESKESYDEEEMNIKMSNKLSELKEALKNNNTNLKEECKDKVQIFEYENNTKMNGISKDAFFGVFDKYHVNIKNKVKDAIFDLFKIETSNYGYDNDIYLLDYDKLCSIL